MPQTNELKDLNVTEFRIEMRRQYPHSFDYLIERIFPKREVHLVAGSPGVGKTTWLLGILMTWMDGGSVLGFKSTPCPWMYVTGDRSVDGNIRTAVRMNIDPKRIPMADLKVKNEEPLVGYLLRLKLKHPEVGLFVIEGLQSFVPKGNGNNYATVAGFLRTLTEFCQKYDVTIIGVCHSAKRKKNDYYESPRDRLMGSGAWSAYADAIVMVESADAEDPEESKRNIFIMPRNDRNRSYMYDWKDGLLVEVDSAIPKFTPLEKFFQYVLAKFSMNSDNMTFSVGDCRTFTGIKANNQWTDLLGVLLAENIIAVMQKGIYRILPYDKVEITKRAGMGSVQ